MIGIQDIGTYVPPGRIDNMARARSLGVDEVFLREKVGMLRLAVKDSDEDTSDLCCRAFAELQRRSGLDVAQVQCAFVCTQNPDLRGLPHTSAAVHAKLGLPQSCAVLDFSLGCSGYVYGLSLIQAFMQANDMQRGVLFTADPYSKIIDPEDKNTSLLFGDAATATLVSTSPVWRSGQSRFGSRGADRSAIQVGATAPRLEMNGRAVFTFCATSVPANIRETLAANGLAVSEVDFFALHQGSRYIVETIRRQLGVAEEHAPFVAADYGNTVSSSIPLMLEQVPEQAQRVVIAGFGVGLSWASTVLYRTQGRTA